MPATNAAAAKKALIDLLAAATGLSGIQVSYTWPGTTLQRECIYAGRVAGSQDQYTMRGGGRVGREEKVVLDLHIVVVKPGGETDVAANETRAVVLGTVVEELIAADGTLGGVAGLKNAYVSDLEMASGLDGDMVFTDLTYQVLLHSYLT